MRKRTFPPVLAALALLAGLVGLASPSHAVTRYTSGSINVPSTATYDHNFSMSGNLNPGCAGRPVVLRDNATNTVLASTTTGSAGYFSFVNYPNPSTRTYNVRSAGRPATATAVSWTVSTLDPSPSRTSVMVSTGSA